LSARLNKGTLKILFPKINHSGKGLRTTNTASFTMDKMH
jgi:hypothetical protein